MSPRFWQWPNIIALDAALVGTSWLWLLTTDFGIPPDTSLACVLTLSIWLVYTADRWLDVGSLPVKLIPTMRHRWVKQNRRVLPAIWLGTLLITLIVAYRGLTSLQLLTGLAVMVLSILHTLGSHVHFTPALPKEARIGLIFAAGISLGVLGQPVPLGPCLLALAAFALLCTLNCLLLAIRECAIDRQLGRFSFALQHRSAARCAHGLAIAICFLGLTLYPTLPVFAHCLLTTACALWLLTPLAPKIPHETYRVLLDTLMLMPSLWLIFAALQP